MVNGETIDKRIFIKGCLEASSRYRELLDVVQHMPDMTIEENARYADLVCRTYAKDAEFVTEQIEAVDRKLLYGVNDRDITASVIGALAYFAINAPTEELREKARVCYDRILRSSLKICCIM